MILLKRILLAGSIITLLTILGVWASNLIVENATGDKVFNSTQQIPHNKVGLLLGTGKMLSNGYVNLYYRYRIDAAVQLFKAGKVDYLLVSGDNSRKSYDEPSTIKADLIEKGVPAERIYLDYAGFRTLDSVVRCKAIFGQKSITVISQQFHNERAIYIAKNKGIDAVGFNAKGVSARYGFKTMVRERLARVKMMLDLFFGKQPKFLGEKITIG
ncbi:MAG: YdcF family protein [Carboxylicivirga sp.]|jgi:SanA protein|nr:YdcF family protein [Carboxylicivirga sp.]